MPRLQSRATATTASTLPAAAFRGLGTEGILSSRSGSKSAPAPQGSEPQPAAQAVLKSPSDAGGLTPQVAAELGTSAVRLAAQLRQRGESSRST